MPEYRAHGRLGAQPARQMPRALAQIAVSAVMGKQFLKQAALERRFQPVKAAACIQAALTRRLMAHGVRALVERSRVA